MDDDDLVRMANQIARQFEGAPEAEARAAIADHLAKFWDPRMRAQLAAIAAANPKGLHVLVRPSGR